MNLLRYYKTIEMESKKVNKFKNKVENTFYIRNLKWGWGVLGVYHIIIIHIKQRRKVSVCVYVMDN